MKMCVTGGAGFIGSHLVEQLIHEGHEVIVLDNLTTGSLDHLAAVEGQYQFVHFDIRNPDLGQFFVSCDVIFHLAGVADVQRSVSCPREYYDVNVTGTLNVMEAVRAQGSCKVIYAASASCYGNTTQLPTLTEERTDPLYPYALTKHLGEQIVLHWGRVYHIPVTSLRLFNVYGPRLRREGAYPSVMSVFLNQLYQRRSLTIVGDGSQTRDFVHVHDVARAFSLAAQGTHQDSVFNVGSGSECSILDLAHYFQGGTEHIPPREGEPARSRACIQTTRSQLGWEPSISLAEGVSMLVTEHASTQHSR